MGRPTKPLPKKLVENKLLSYIFGAILGDGCLDNKNNNYAVELYVNDKDFALVFKKSLEEWSGFEVSFHINNKQYQVVLHSKSVVIFLEKYNTISKIKKLVMKVEGEKEFLLSMFDGEGWIGDKAIGISNNNKQLLLLCKKLLKNLGIESGKIYISTKKNTPYKFSETDKGFTNFNNYAFYINGKSNLIKFKDLVGFNIKRKQDKLVHEISSYRK